MRNPIMYRKPVGAPGTAKLAGGQLRYTAAAIGASENLNELNWKAGQAGRGPVRRQCFIP